MRCRSRFPSLCQTSSVPYRRAAVVKTRNLVTRLLLQGVSEDEILHELWGIPGGERTLRRAAKSLAGLHYWPAARVNALLLAAADGRAAPVETPEDRDEIEGVRELMRLDTAAAFALLTERVPSLRELEAAALNPQQVRPPVLGRRGPSDPEKRSQAQLWALIKRATAMVGPRSGQMDRLAASPAAFAVVVKHLHALLGVPLPGE
jgi:hypothetical protein